MQNNKNKDWNLLIALLVVYIISLVLALVVMFFYTGNKPVLERLTRELETWSVTHPTSIYSHNEVFPLNDFIEDSSSKNKLWASYNVKRVSTANHDVICFIKAKDESKIKAYSYQMGWVDSTVCSP